MPSAILKFKLPEERDEFDLACNSVKYNLVLFELDNYLRAQVKYPSEKQTESEIKAYEIIRNKLHELLIDNNLEL